MNIKSILLAVTLAMTGLVAMAVTPVEALNDLKQRIAPLKRSHCLFRMTRSGRFLLRRIAHWATASLAPPQSHSCRFCVVEKIVNHIPHRNIHLGMFLCLFSLDRQVVIQIILCGGKME